MDIRFAVNVLSLGLSLAAVAVGVRNYVVTEAQWRRVKALAGEVDAFEAKERGLREVDAVRN